MPLGARSLRLHSSLRDFIRQGDYLFANFEGTITEQPKKALFSPSDQRQNKEILRQLERVFPPDRTYLCLANNHAGDLGKDEFYASLNLLKAHGFRVFGYKDEPFSDVNDGLRVIGGTMWSNRRCDYISRLEAAADYLKPAAFNILFAHFGYEHELYPRPKIVDLSRQLISKFDCIVGHHSHCPQPVSREMVAGKNRLLAYSLGNFCAASKKKSYQAGICLKLSIGLDGQGRWLAAAVESRHIRVCILQNGDCLVI